MSGLIEGAELRTAVAHRVRVTAYELGYRSAQSFAEYLGANRPQVAAWFNAVAMPPVKYMNKLAVERGITLDWIYRGDGSGLSHALYIRLTAAMEAVEPPPDVEPEPEPAQDSEVMALRLRKALPGTYRQEKRKRATAT
jgi:transcriptional regulator with XRE-family HTH domain